jgi:YHS domain-containing protein
LKDVPNGENAPPTTESPRKAREPEVRPHLPAGSSTPHTGFKGFCAVSVYYRKLIKAKPELSSEYNSRIYQFATAEAKAEFDKSPSRFVPVSDGYDTVIQIEDDEKVEGSLDYAAWYLGRLYMFSCQANLTLFHTAPEDFCEEAVNNIEKERLKSDKVESPSIDDEADDEMDDEADDDDPPAATGEPKPAAGGALLPVAPQSDIKSGPGPVITPNPAKISPLSSKIPAPKGKPMSTPMPSPF